MEVGLGTGHIVFHGDPAPPPKGAQFPIFSPCLSSPSRWWIKMPLGTRVGLGPGHIVLDGETVPLKEHISPSPFSAYVYCAKATLC